MTENSLAIGSESDTEKCVHRVTRFVDEIRTLLLGLLMPDAHVPAIKESSRPVNWKERDQWIELSVRMGLNAREISEFSYSWPQPVTTTTQVFQMIDRLNLRRAYNRSRKLRGGHHHANIAFAFTKLCGQAMEWDYEVTDVLRDESPVEGSRFRPDLGFQIDGKLFYVEAQLSGSSTPDGARSSEIT